MYEDLTPEVLRARMLAAATGGISTEEGSFASDVYAPMSVEAYKIYGNIDMAIDSFFVQTSQGQYLDDAGAQVGVERRPGTNATGTVTVTGTTGATVPAGTLFTTNEGLQFAADAAATLADGTAQVEATAVAAGSEYNILAGEIARLVTPVSGVTGATNAAAFAGGTDIESDDALRERILLRMRQPATSGNAAHYREWALSVPGVGDAKITPLVNGPGTVGVLICDSNKLPPTTELVQAVADYIETVRPIGATVTVTGAVAKTINVAATAVLEGVEAAAVQASYEDALTAFFAEVAFNLDSVSVNRAAYLLMSIPGVTDYTSLTLNGAAQSVTIADNEVPVLGTCTVTEGTAG